MFKNMNIKKVSLWLFVIMAVSFAIAAAIFFQTGGYEKATIKHTIEDSKTFALEGIKEIKISAVSADINVIPVDTNEVSAHFYGNSTSNQVEKYPKLTGKIENNKIIIKVEETFKIGFNIGFNNNLKLDISVPKAYSEDISINTTSGDTFIEKLSLNNFKFNSVSGELDLNKLNSKVSELSTVSGDLTVTEFTGDIALNSVSGKLSVDYASFDNDIRVGTTSGDTKIILPENAEFYLDFSTVSGDANCNFPITTEGTQKRRGLKGSVGSTNNEIRISSISGELDILRNR
jgi:lia operon protein LiaG